MDTHPNKSEQKTILFLAANPSNKTRLQLDTEVREIQDELTKATRRDEFNFKTIWAVTPRDMQDTILREQPHIVHFSGHGGADGLALEDGEGQAKLVNTAALSSMFKLFSDRVECVLLNACYSDFQSEEIAQHIPFTIGMAEAIGDRAAIEFAVGFYTALGEGKDVEFAYRYGCNSIGLQGIPEENTPVLIRRNRRRRTTHRKSNEKSTANSTQGFIPTADDGLIVFQPSAVASTDDSAAASPSTLTPDIIRLAAQEGAVSLDSPFYLSPLLSEQAYQAIEDVGALLRIKSPQGMGKSSLLNRVLRHAEDQDYRTVVLDFKPTNARFFENLDQFIQWFCASVGKPLGIRVKTDEYWDDIFGPNDNCTDYFERYLLTGKPLTLALENFDKLFDYAEIEVDFCGLLRGWHERAKRDSQWEQLRLIIVYSQESYEPKDINQSPFNVGVPVELTPWTEDEVSALAKRYGLNLDTPTLYQIVDLTGGHPELVQLTLCRLTLNEIDLEQLQKTAATEAGIYRAHLVERLNYLEAHPELKVAMQTVVNANRPVRLASKDVYRLDSMGLIRRVDNEVEPLCETYRVYFQERLSV